MAEFSETDVRRIAREVVRMERTPRNDRARLPRPRVVSIGATSLLMRAAADIANGASATCNAVAIDDVCALTEDTAVTFTVCNVLLPKIWNDSYLVASNVGGQWIAISAYSATMLRGLQVGALATSDTTNAIDNLNDINGELDDTSVTSQNILDWAADDNADTYAVWNDEDSQWEMIQVKCPA